MNRDLNFCHKYIQTWLDAMLNDENKELLLAWHGLRDWTRAHMDLVLMPLSEKLGYCNNYENNVSKEYYRIDFSLYTHYGSSIWTLDYAVEHENAEFELSADGIKNKGWFDEFAKLLPLSCKKARIIIGYDRFDDVEAFNRKIDYCENLLNDDNIKDYITKSPIFLIIFPRTKYIKRRRYDNGLVRIVRFFNNNGKWETDKLLANEICNEDMNFRLKSVYDKIVEL